MLNYNISTNKLYSQRASSDFRMLTCETILQEMELAGKRGMNRLIIGLLVSLAVTVGLWV